MYDHNTITSITRSSARSAGGTNSVAFELLLLTFSVAILAQARTPSRTPPAGWRGSWACPDPSVSPAAARDGEQWHGAPTPIVPPNGPHPNFPAPPRNGIAMFVLPRPTRPIGSGAVIATPVGPPRRNPTRQRRPRIGGPTRANGTVARLPPSTRPAGTLPQGAQRQATTPKARRCPLGRRPPRWATRLPSLPWRTSKG